MNSHTTTSKFIHWTFSLLYAYGIFKQVDELEQLEDASLLNSEIVFAVAFLVVVFIRYFYMKGTPTLLGAHDEMRKGHLLIAKTFLPHIPAHEYPGHSLACEIYLIGGVRAVELGTLAFGVAGEDGKNDTPATHELVRLAAPRRSYTQSHFDYVAEVLEKLVEKKDTLKGYEITYQPKLLRHFTAKLKPIS